MSRGHGRLISTFSVIGYDPAEAAWGIAIASRFLAVGAGTRWGRAGAGVVVIQAHFNARNGAEGVELLARGGGASEVIAQLMAKDRHRDVRQMGVIDAEGRPATYTGERCTPWASGKVGQHCAAQGNTMPGPQVVETIVERFTSQSGTLARRLVDALTAGDQAGGDQRGKQATALLVVRQDPDDLLDVFSHRTIDLRVDDHPRPFAELSRLLDLYELIYQPSMPVDRLLPDAPTVRRLQLALMRLGYFRGPATGLLDEATRTAVADLARLHNLRQRLSTLEWIDRRVLAYVEKQTRGA